MNCYTQKEIQEFKRIKKKEIKYLNDVWNKNNVGDPKKIGYIINIVEELNPSNFEEFFEKGKEKIGIDNLNFIFTKMKSILRKEKEFDLDNKENIETILKFVFLRVFYETFIGFKGEQDFKEYCNEILEIRSVDKTTKENDHQYGIDFILTLQNGKRLGIQIKPVTFLLKCMTQPQICYSLKNKMEIGKKELNLDLCDIYFVDIDKFSSTSKDKLLQDILNLQRGNK